MKLSLLIDPGSSARSAIQVFNSGDETMRVVVSVSDWTATLDGGMDLAPSAAIERSATAWVVPDLGEFILRPRDNRIVRLESFLPDSARGSYWTIVFFEGEPAARGAGLGFVTKARIGTTVYLTARGTEERDDSLTRVEALGGPGMESIDLAFCLQNRGNVHHYPRGWIQVLDTQDRIHLQETIPLRVLLPASEACYHQAWQPDLSGTYRLVVTLDIGLETLIQGIREFVVADTLQFVKAASSEPAPVAAGVPPVVTAE